MLIRPGRTRHVGSLLLVCLLTGILAGADEPPKFRDRTAELGLSPGSGSACWVDFDNDGWVDLCAGGSVWKNNEGKGFLKLAEAGPSVAADFDNDGFVDLFNWSEMRLLRNAEGRGVIPVSLPPLLKTVSLGACWADFNQDGFADLYIPGFEDWDNNITFPSYVLKNRGGKEFVLTATDSRFRSRGVTACDFDQDGDADVYVSNYRLQPNQLLQNNGMGELKDVASPLNAVATSPGFPGGHSIGAVWGDFDNDGLFDLFAGNFAHQDARGDQPKSRFLRNLGPTKEHAFEDRGECGVFYQESYASPSAADFDNDGDVDLFFTTVYADATFGRKSYPVLFQNTGRFAFTDISTATGLNGLGPTYQNAWADFDNDGDLDLMTAGRLFENQAQGNAWLKVRLHGDGRIVNRSAIGAQVRIRLPSGTLTRQVEAGTGQGNQNALVMHFGLGRTPGPVRVEILWPGGTRQDVETVEINREIKVEFSP